MNAFLKPLGKLFGGLTAVRNNLFDRELLGSYRSSLPVISIGNMTVGGNGKTPLCMLIASSLNAAGQKVVILSRGYKGAAQGPHLVKPGDNADFVGDEPLLMAQKLTCPVVVAKDRVAGAKFIESEKLGSVILLDDGFQHRRLVRNLNIVAEALETEQLVEDFCRGQMLPVGRFRENKAGAWKRVDIFVVGVGEAAKLTQPLSGRIQSEIAGDVQVFKSAIVPSGVQSAEDSKALAPCEAVAFCGIARGERFFSALQQAGFKLVDALQYPDHYAFQPSDLDDLRRRFPGLPLICTEKDLVKIPQDARQQIYVLQVQMVLSGQDGFIELIRSRI